ncbi:cation transporting ATPase C-terminal domain-containing protein [Parapedobacter sp. GCM10030251]|uniref:cation transporting ATPase C-terminal domain-containing protein n=1 Tax=Parapedobacter sp. GCM10030251 TaxID=3273419 RepID=UPI00361C0759
MSFANRSFYYSIFERFRSRNPLLTGITVLVLVILFAILYVEPLSRFFDVTSLRASELGICMALATVSVLWFEVYKWFRRKANSLSAHAGQAHDGSREGL